MAVPTITRILPAGADISEPAVGPTAGRSFVDIFGSGYRMPPADSGDGPSAPPLGGVVVASVQKTVSVTFGGAEAPEVQVISPIHLRVVTPISPIEVNNANDNGQGPVDVVITNLDDNGDPIAGESVTLAGGYTYRRPALDTVNASDLRRLVLQLLLEVKRQVLANAVITTETDYDSDVGTPGIEVAEMPAIVLVGPTLQENRFYGTPDRRDERQGQQVRIARNPRTDDLGFDFVGITDSTMQILDLMAAANEFMERNPFIYLQRDPDDPSAGVVEYEFDFQPGGDFTANTSANSSNIRSFTGSVVIRGFTTTAFAGFAGDDLADLSVENTQGVNLDVERFAG